MVGAILHLVRGARVTLNCQFLRRIALVAASFSPLGLLRHRAEPQRIASERSHDERPGRVL